MPALKQISAPASVALQFAAGAADLERLNGEQVRQSSANKVQHDVANRRERPDEVGAEVDALEDIDNLEADIIIKFTPLPTRKGMRVLRAKSRLCCCRWIGCCPARY